MHASGSTDQGSVILTCKLWCWIICLFFPAFVLHTTAVKPKAQLTTNSRDVPVAGKVTLNCSVNLSSEWKYFWYRGNKSSEPLTTQDAAPSDGQISVSGLYRSRAGRGNPVYYTDYSDPVNIDKNSEFDWKLMSIQPSKDCCEPFNLTIFNMIFV